jgi:DNA (cytosine-5)-methyltransferase 1
MSLTMTDLFCGGGGSSTGAIQNPEVRIAIAANHWQLACDVHNANHPDTDHAVVDLHQEDPRYFPKTDLLWASPECRKWSQGNGATLPAIEEGLFEDPLSDEASQRSRLLMFDVLRFIEHHRYRLVFVENVVDIAILVKYQLAWAVWRQELRRLGYQFRVISLNSMHAQAFGLPAPQPRDRIYIAAWPARETPPDFERILRPRAYCSRCDAIVEAQQAWKPRRDVGRYRQAYVYMHASCGTIVEPGWLPGATAVDWTILGEPIGDRLKPKTRLRIAAGICRYWGPLILEEKGNTYDAADPRHPQHGDPNAYYRAWPVDEVLRTLYTDETKALAVPVEARDGLDPRTLAEPFRTQTTRLETGMVTPFIAELRGGSSDARSVDEALSTVTAGGNHHALVTPYYGNSDHGKPTELPLGTLTTVDRFALVHRMNSGGAEMTTPAAEYLRTLTSKGHQALIQAEVRGGRPKVTPADLKAAEQLVPECLFRMFRPHEVAAGMAFPRDYDWHPDKTKPVSNRDLVKMAGNAVTPPSSRDLVNVAVEALS